MLYDKWGIAAMKRYIYCREHPSIPPFPGSYDQQPAWWIDASGIIDREITALSNCQCFACKSPSKGIANA